MASILQGQYRMVTLHLAATKQLSIGYYPFGKPRIFGLLAVRLGNTVGDIVGFLKLWIGGGMTDHENEISAPVLISAEGTILTETPASWNAPQMEGKPPGR